MLSKKSVHRIVIPLVAGFAITGGLMTDHAASAQAKAKRSVVINQARVPDDTLGMLEQQFQTKVPDGRYWYDAVSGAWGLESGPTLGFTLPGLPIGGRLRADASKGNTSIFINGRELPQSDVQGLQRLVGPILPGRYWVDGQGYAGYEGGPALFNLRAIAAQQASITRGPGAGVGENYGGGAWSYNNSNTGIGVLSDGQGGMLITDH